MRLTLVLVVIFGLSNCYGDETVRGHGAADKEWRLVELTGAAYDGPATLTFPEMGKIGGRAPCNRYTATMDAPYPWFDAGPIAATRMACPNLEAETRFFEALEAATLSEVMGNTLILSDDNGVLLVFKSGG